MLPHLDPWGFVLGGILSLAITLGILLPYLQRVRKALQQSEERFRAISTYTSDWEIWLGTNGQPLWMNAAASRMTGLSNAEALAMPDYPLPLVEEEDRAAVRAALELVAGGGIIDDQLFRVRRRDNSPLWASLSAQQIFATDGTLLGSRLSIRDVSMIVHYKEDVGRKRLLLQSVLDNTSDAIIALDQEFRVIFFNSRFLEMWGISRAFLYQQPTMQELIAEACRSGLYPAAEEEELGRKRIAQLRSGGDRIVLETPRQDGVIVESFAAPLPGIGYLLTYRDVTERKTAQNKLDDKHLLMNTLIQSLPDPVWFKDLNGVFVTCNDAFCQVFNDIPSNIIGRKDNDFVDEELATFFQQRDREVIAAGHPLTNEEWVTYASDGHQALWETTKTPVFDIGGQAVGALGVARDITARKGVELALKESENRYKKLFREFETIFNGIPDSLTVWSNEPRLLWANNSSAAHYGVPTGELIGKACQDLCAIQFDHDSSCEVRRCFASEALEEGIRKSRNGSTWGVKTFPLRNAAGEVDRVIRVASDLTERMVLREETARAAHLAALGELAAGMAHEINNPTSLILLEMPILLEAFRDIVEILEEHFLIHGDFPCGGLRYSKMRIQVPAMLVEILDSAERIKYIVEELRDFSHPTEAKQFAAIDLNDVTRKALSLVSNQIKKATDHFTVIYAPTPTRSLGTLQRLEQVLINLILNACQAIPDRGCSLSVEVGSWPERRRNFIRVCDSGIGIQPEHLALITDPFFTTRRSTGGTGLGLSVSSRIIEEHGGTLHFASEVGKGTLVTIELPLIEENELS